MITFGVGRLEIGRGHEADVGIQFTYIRTHCAWTVVDDPVEQFDYEAVEIVTDRR